MSRHLVRAVYLVTTLVVGPLVAYWVAVAGIRYGLDWRGFALVLLGLPAALAVLAAGLLRVGKRGAAVGVAGAVTATISLVVALVFVYLAAR